MPRWSLCAGFAACWLTACGAGICEPSNELTPPTRLCTREAPDGPCRAPEQIEELMRHPDLELLSSAQPSSGRQGARILTVTAPSELGPVRFRVKWRALDTSHGLNDPRRELVAHALQRLLLSPHDWVLPPTVGHCFDLGHYRTELMADAGASFPGASCVFGTMSHWLEHARDLDYVHDHHWFAGPGVLDRKAFDDIPSYRRTLADNNLLAHVTSNGDTHSAQFIFTGNARQPRVYLVDYTISLSDYRNPKLQPNDDWSIIHVPLSAETIARARQLRLADLEKLLVIEEWENRGGLLFRSYATPPARRELGLRWSGSRLQVGLSETEISYVWSRLQKLLARIDRRELATF